MLLLKQTGRIISWSGLILFVSGVILFYNYLPDFYLIYLGLFLLLSGLGLLSLRLVMKAAKEKKQDIFKIFACCILLFWCFCGLFGLTIMAIGNIVFKNSGAYREATRYIIHEHQFTKNWGKIHGFGFMTGGSLSPGEARLHFSVRTEKGSPDVEVFLKRINNKWVVKSVEGL